MTEQNNVIERLSQHEADEPLFLWRFMGWLVAEDADFVTRMLDRVEAFAVAEVAS